MSALVALAPGMGAWGQARLELTYESPVECVRPGDAVFLDVWMRGVDPDRACGFQAFLTFDPTVMDFVGGLYTDEPFGLPIVDPIVANGDAVDLASGVDVLRGQECASGEAWLATLVFEARDVDATTTFDFRPHLPPTPISTDQGETIEPLELLGSGPLRVDPACDAGVKCSDFKKLKAKCLEGGKIKGKAILFDREHEGEIVTLVIDDVERLGAVIKKNKAKFKPCCFKPGVHAVEITFPANCLRINVEC